MSEIKVGDYVRINGIIGKVEQIGNSLFWLEDGSSYSLNDKSIKHSKIISEVVEVGDYVNGKQIHKIDKGQNYCYLYYENCKTLVYYQIETILTHEQYEQNCYKVKGELY